MARRRCYSPYPPANRNAPNPGAQASRWDNFAINKSGGDIRPVTVRQIPLAVPVQEDWITLSGLYRRIDRLVAASNVPGEAHAVPLTKRSAGPSLPMRVLSPRTSTPEKDFNRIFHVLYLLLWKMVTRRGEYSPDFIFKPFLNILTAYPQIHPRLPARRRAVSSSPRHDFDEVHRLLTHGVDPGHGGEDLLREFSLFPRLCRFSTVPARIDCAIGQESVNLIYPFWKAARTVSSHSSVVSSRIISIVPQTPERL